MREDKIVTLDSAQFRKDDVISFLGKAPSSDGRGGRHVVRVADRTPDGQRTFLLTRSELPLESGGYAYDSFQIHRGAITKLPGVEKAWLTRKTDWPTV